MLSALQSRYDKTFDASIGRLWIARLWNRFDRDALSTRPMLVRTDVLIALCFAVVGSAVSVWAFSQTNRVPELHTMFNLWIHADSARVAENIVTTGGDHGRTSVHPLFSILTYPFGALLTALGLAPLTAAKTLVVIVMGATTAMFSLTTRLVGLPRFVSAAFTALFTATASFLYWGGVVETFPFSCFAVVTSLFMMLRVNTPHWGWWVLVNVLTIGVLITNWVIALVAMAVRLKLKPFIAIAVSSFALVIVLAVIQNLCFEKAALFFNPHTLTREAAYFQTNMAAEGTYEQGWQPAANLRSMYVTTVVAMPVEVQQQTHMRLATTNQNTAFREGEIIPVIAVISWVVLFGMGVWGAILRSSLRLPVIGAALMLTAQTILHLIYGEVTFLYSLSFMPLIILFASMSWFAPYRYVGLGLVVLVIAFGGTNNVRRLQETVSIGDCLSDIDFVRQGQTWDLIRDAKPPETSDYQTLDFDTENLCQPGSTPDEAGVQP
jgi:hypothetical protein